MKLLVLSLFLSAVCSVPLTPSHPFKAEQSRIVGGTVARANQFPYATSIRRRTALGTYFCGGSLISDRWALTAGSCVQDAQTFTIHLGTLYSDGSDTNGWILATGAFVQHPDYNANTYEGDIGLILFRELIQFSNSLRPVDFLAQADLIAGLEVVAIGWGATSDTTVSLAAELNYVTVTTLTSADCRVTYGDVILDSMICAEGQYNEGSCAGDIGGPLISYIRNGEAMQVGISSFISARGCETTDPSGYTKINSYRQWIAETSGIQ